MQHKPGSTPATVADGPTLDADQNAYQMMLAGLVFPLLAHFAFNAVAALAILLIGHPWAAVAVFVGASSIDTVQRTLVRRWTAESATADPDKGLRKLAVLCAIRVSIYIAPATAITVATRGFGELTFFTLQFASLLALSLGVGSISRLIFWAFCAPIIVAATSIAVLMFPPVQAIGVLLALSSLLALLLFVSEGTTRTIQSWYAAYRANLALVEELAHARDQAVAEREAADLAREVARSANSAKSNFLATMSHEIRTPMNGVLGMAQLMKRDEDDPVQTRRLDVLIDSGEYLLSILNDILDVSKIDAGKLELMVAPESPDVFLRRVIGFWGGRADEQGVRLSLQMGSDMPEWVMFDALRLRQVLFNLIGNALKFTEQGSVTITADAVSRTGGLVDLHLAVRDTGPGIAEHHMDALFDRFSQGEDADARRFGGTGLGLAIVKQLVELMGGRVWADTRLGEGSTFHVQVPLEVTHAPAEAEPASPTDVLGVEALRVLAVDDNAVNLLVLEQLLASLGHEIAKASSGLQALEILDAEAFDLVLADIQMPGMSGIEMLQRLRDRPGHNQAVPVIAITADVTSGGRQRYLDLGFTEHAAKPIQLEDLLASMARALEAPEAAVQAA